MKKIDRRSFIKLCKSAGFISLFPFGKPFFISGLDKNIEPPEIKWCKTVREFPSLSLDKYDQLWIAVLEKKLPEKYITIFSYRQDELYEMFKVRPEGITGISNPKLSGNGDSLILVFSIEIDSTWQVAYTFIDPDGSNDVLRVNIISSECKSNITPAVALSKEKALVTWEGESKNGRCIFAAQVNKKGASNAIMISKDSVNSNNPAIVALPNGNMFAAWDSVRGEGANIFGAWFKKGKWQNEIRLTSDVRLERHPFLICHENEVWMCWEAQSYLQGFSNNITEQRVVVAKLNGKELMTPLNLFEQVSPKTHPNSELSETSAIIPYENEPRNEYNLVLPHIAFDKNGALWLSAREFAGKRQEGSKPVLWSYSGEEWIKYKLSNQQGKRQPVEIIFGKNGGFAAFQYDNLPLTWDQQGDFPDWKSGFVISKIKDVDENKEVITEPLRMPSSSFSILHDKLKTQSYLDKIPATRYRNKHLRLFWGDLHSHSDISVCCRAWNQAPKDCYNIMRDVEKLDFCALTDHGYSFDKPQWDFMGEEVRKNHDENNFVIFLGQEWTSQNNPPDAPKEKQKYGHHNIILKSPYHRFFYDAYDGDFNPKELWDRLKKDNAEFIFIPHQLADMGTNIPVDWDFVDEKLQPVAEIFQGRGSYEYLGCPRQAKDGAAFKGHYLQDVWAKKNIIGVTASPDHWGGIGKTGVWAEKLNRDSIFSAIQSRHTFGTTGSKIGLLFQTPQVIMGDKITLASNPVYHFEIKAWAKTKIDEVTIFRNNVIVYKTSPGKTTLEIEWVDKDPLMGVFSWYYARIKCIDNELAWSSPIWFI